MLFRSRGIDIDQLPHVVNFELPNVAEDYVHRIGRTGRAGNEGEAMSLVCVDELKLLKDIEKLIKREIPKDVIEGYEPDPSIKAQPIRNGRNNNAGGKGRSQQRSSSKRHSGNGNTKKAPRAGKNARKKTADKNNQSASPWKKRTNNQNRKRDAA